MSRDHDTVAWVLENCSRAPLLTAAQEIHLATLIQAGKAEDATPGQKRAAKRARDTFMRSNMRLVVSVARGYKRRIEHSVALDFEDLISEGMIGLARGVDLFDPTRGYKASTFLHWWIRQSISRAIGNNSHTIRLPVHLHEVLTRARYAPPGLDREELAVHCRCTVEHLDRAMLALRQAPTSLDQVLNDGDGDALVALIGSEDRTNEDLWFAEDLNAAIERLRTLDPDAIAIEELRAEGSRVLEFAPLLDCGSVSSASAKLKATRRRLQRLAAETGALEILRQA